MLLTESGTAALTAALVGLQRDHEAQVVAIPAYSCYDVATAVEGAGARALLYDIDPRTLGPDLVQVEAALRRGATAVVVAHLYGCPVDLTTVKRLAVAAGAVVIEDAAQAFGSPDIARGGIASTFSFYPTKNLFCIGDGGLVSTDDPELAERVRMLRFHGSLDKVDFELIGYNSRLDEIQAAVLRIFLAELDGWVVSRREAAARYAELGLGAACELPEDEPGHVYHLFVCRSPERDRVRAGLTEAGIGSAVYYTTPLHLQPALAYLGYSRGALPVTEQLAQENFSVPIWAGIDAPTQEQIVSVVQASAPVAS